MRICMVALSGFSPAQKSGPATVAHFLTKEFARKGHDVTALVRANDRHDQTILSRLQAADDFRSVRFHPIRVNYASAWRSVPGYLPLKVVESALRFSTTDADAVIYNSPPVDAGILLPLLARQTTGRQIAIVHGGLFLEFGTLRRTVFRMHRRSLDAFVAVSRFMKDVMISQGFPQELIHIIPNGVDAATIRQRPAAILEGNPKILFVGRLAPIKDVPTLLAAFSRFVDRVPDARLYLVGDGPEASKLKRLAGDLGVGDKARFVGSVSPPDLYDYYRGCDVLVLPSLSESFGLVLLEAMAAGLPVVASSGQGGVATEITDGVTGFLFPAGDSEELEAVLRRIWVDDSGGRAVAARALEWVRNFTWGSTAERYLSLLAGA